MCVRFQWLVTHLSAWSLMELQVTKFYRYLLTGKITIMWLFSLRTITMLFWNLTQFSNVWNKKLTAVSGISAASQYVMSSYTELNSAESILYQAMNIRQESPTKYLWFITAYNTSDGTVHGKQYKRSEPYESACFFLNAILKESMFYFSLRLGIAAINPILYTYVGGYNIDSDTFIQPFRLTPYGKYGSIVNFGTESTSQR